MLRAEYYNNYFSYDTTAFINSPYAVLAQGPAHNQQQHQQLQHQQLQQQLQLQQQQQIQAERQRLVEIAAREAAEADQRAQAAEHACLMDYKKNYGRRNEPAISLVEILVTKELILSQASMSCYLKTWAQLNMFGVQLC